MPAVTIVSRLITPLSLLTFMAVAAFALACGDGQPTDPPPGPTNPPSEEERVSAAVGDVYEYVSEGNYEALWSAYTSTFQERCSFDDMVGFTEEFKQSEGWDELVPTQIKVTFTGGHAVADYLIEAKADGAVLNTYEYQVTYFEEDGEWRAEEDCF